MDSFTDHIVFASYLHSTILSLILIPYTTKIKSELFWGNFFRYDTHDLL